MDAFRPLSGLALLFLLVGAVQAQTETDFALFSTVSGSLASGNTDTWTFSAADGAMLSFEVRSVSGDLDPVLTLSNSSGTFSLSDDDRNYPDSRDPLLEAITIPRTDTYSLTVSAYGDTSGDYQLTMLPGYARLDQEILFDDPSVWTSNLDDQQMLLGNNRMALVLSGLQERAIVIDSAGGPQNDQFLRVEIPELTGPNGWQVGLVARQQDQTDYYLYSLNQNGQWQFSVNTAAGERILRDWSSHPAIVAGQTGISLGMLANGSDFEFFYNDQLIGHVSDDTLQRAGQAGLMAATPPVIGSELTAQFERFTITTPAPDTSYPQQIQTGTSSVMIQQLQRRGLIPPNGQLSLLVPESFLTFNRPGVNQLLLGGSDQQFRNFALGTTFTWEISSPDLPAGCGLLLRFQDDEEYLLAYADQTGAFGLSPRRRNTFEPGIFGQGLTLDNGPHRLLIIANNEQLLYYLDGQFAGTLQVSAVTGRVANAVVNFESVTTSCHFTDSWVWAWG